MPPHERLTRSELSWLLTQEARGAASRLRQGVQILAKSEPSAPPGDDEEARLGIATSLDALDGAVGMLARLHGGTVPRGRRGRIDVVALLWEVAPEARASIEVGEGTSVFGDEGELRRMLHVLLSQAGDPAAASAAATVQIRREGDEVRVGVPLGPDQSATFDTERAWLGRMATRYGGRVELDGATYSLVLPADVDSRRREVEELRRELAEAQALGEAYARELAAILAQHEGGDGEGAGAEGLGPMPEAQAGAVRAIAGELRVILGDLGQVAAALRIGRSDPAEAATSITRAAAAAAALVAELGRLASPSPPGAGAD